MLKALKEIGFKKALKFAVGAPLLIIFDLLPYPQLRTLFLRLFGAKIGKGAIIGRVKFTNVYRTGFSGLDIGDFCVLGDYVILDLANRITLEEHAGIGWGTILVTHLNVGYKDHPLQKYFPTTDRDIRIKRGAFIGVHSTILTGVTVGACAFVAAGSVINKDVPDGAVIGPPPAAELLSVRMPVKG